MAEQITAGLDTPRSMLLRVVSWIYKLAGALFAFMAVLALLGPALSWTPTPGGLSYWVGALGLLAIAAALFLTGSLLTRRLRTGAYLALALTVYPFAFVALGQRPLHWTDLVLTAVTFAAFIIIWPELEPARARA